MKNFRDNFIYMIEIIEKNNKIEIKGIIVGIEKERCILI